MKYDGDKVFCTLAKLGSLSTNTLTVIIIYFKFIHHTLNDIVSKYNAFCS